MDKRFLGCLGCTGVAAIVVLLFPAAALIGYFMGIVPGIFLGVSPALFVYLVIWWVLRWVTLKIASFAGFDLNARMVRWTANIVAIAIDPPPDCRRIRLLYEPRRGRRRTRAGPDNPT